MLILLGSPHAGGVCDQIGAAISDGLRSEHANVNLVALRDYTFLPCRGCQTCLQTSGACLLPKDGADFIFSKLFEEDFLILIAPVYFYALPGQLKMFIDRSQKFWADLDALKFQLFKKAGVILTAGRENGENIFKGSILTLKWFLKPFGYKLVYEKPIRGVDCWEDKENMILINAQSANKEIKQLLIDGFS